MRPLLLALCTATLLSPAALYAQACSSEVEALKARVLELEAQLAARPAAIAPLGTMSGLSSIAPGTSAGAQIGEGPNKVVRRVVVIEEVPYSRTGCSLGLFQGTAPGKWKDANAWETLQKGMPAAEVEAQLGIEHFNLGSGTRQIWQYGKCGNQAVGQVLLQDGRVEQWRAPEN